MDLKITNNYYFPEKEVKALHGKLDFIIQKLTKMGENLDQLNQKVTELEGKVDTLQTAIDADQASDAQVVAALKDEIATLQGQLANGATPEELAALSSRLQGIAAKVEASTSDVSDNAQAGNQP